VARSEAKLAGNAEALKQLTGNNHIFTQLMDLANLDFVASAAAEVAAKFPSINVLINNAGIMACPLSPVPCPLSRITQGLNHRWASIISATLSSPWRCCQRLAFTHFSLERLIQALTPLPVGRLLRLRPKRHCKSPTSKRLMAKNPPNRKSPSSRNTVMPPQVFHNTLSLGNCQLAFFSPVFQSAAKYS